MQLYDTHPRARTRRASRVGKRLVASATVAALASIGIAGAAQAVPNDDITDPVLRACVEAALGLNPGDEITVAAAAALTELTCMGDSNTAEYIQSTAGIEHLTGLTKLILQGHYSDDSAFDGLSDLVAPNLVHLELNSNTLTTVAPIAHMTTLERLSVLNNGITSLEPLRNMDNLVHLDASTNQVSDLDPIADKTSLESLWLTINDLDQQDLDTIADLENLETLAVADLGLTDVTPLADLENLVWLNLNDNHLVDLSPLSELGLTTLFAARQTVDLGRVALGESIPNPVADPNGDPVALDGFYNAGDNTFTPTAEGTASVDWNDNNNFDGTLSFTAVDGIDIPDLELLACINGQLGQGATDLVSASQVAGITDLVCGYVAGDPAITNLDGIHHLTSLASLSIGGHGLEQAEINKLAVLTTLDWLIVDNNQIDDLSFVEDMVLLEGFVAPVNNIDDLTPLAGLPVLNTVVVDNNHIADMSPLGSLGLLAFTATAQTLEAGDVPVGSLEPNPVVAAGGTSVPLDDLYLYGPNSFSPDVEGPGTVTWDAGVDFDGTISFTGTAAVYITIPDPALLECVNDELSQGPGDGVTPAQAAGISSLYCDDMGIEDLSGIEHFTNLGVFYASGNLISDLSPLTALGGISTGIDFSDNLISDVTPLSTMFFGEQVNLSGNQIVDLSPMSGMSGNAYVNAADQEVNLGTLAINQAQPNPVLGFFGLPLGLSAFYDAATNTFTPSAPGAGQTAWDHAPTDAEPWAFSGTLLFDVAAEDEVVPVDPDAPAPAEPAPAEPAPAEPEGLAATGAPSVLAPLGGAAMLLLLGLGLVSSRRLRGLIN